MKKSLLLILLCLCSVLSAQTKVSFDSLCIHYDDYLNQTITLTTPMVVTGVWYDSLILSPNRLFVPEEQAIGLSEGDSTELNRLRRYNHDHSLRLQAKYYPYQVRTGAIINNLTARVTAPRTLTTGQTPKFAHNRVPIRRPSIPKDANLVICAANIQNYFADLGGYAGAKTEEQFIRQTEKVARALRHLDADIYTICEMERGNRSPEVLCHRMNQLAKKELYTWVNNDGGNGDGDTISVCYIYRKDRVRPYGPILYAYPDTFNIYHHRFKTCGFEHLATGERLCISLNHPRSKRGDPHRADSLRMQNIYHIDSVLTLIQDSNIYDDPDLLLVGDYNCYTYERPLRYLISRSYEDQLIRFAPQDYSYVYRGESGYLDRVFANHSMASQILMVTPVHLCADYFYSLGYRSKYSKSKSLLRYSDHDPLLIAIQLLH